MIEFALRRRLQPLISRRRRLYLAWRLSLCWLVFGLAGLCLTGIDWLWGWNSAIVNWIWLIGVVFATAFAVYKYRHMHPDYREVARNIEKQNPETKALLLAAIEQEPEKPGRQLGYLQERVIGEALRHAIDHDWIQSIPKKKLIFANIGRFAALAFVIVVLSQIFPFRPLLFTTNKGILTGRGYQISVTPEDTKVELGTSVVILARFSGRVPQEASMFFGSPGEEPQQVMLTKNLEDPVFGGIIQQVESNLIYHIEYANKRTRDYEITVFEYPELEKADAKIIYPLYTKLPEKSVKDTRQISAVEGSKIEFTFTLNKPVATARLVPREGFGVNLMVDGNNPSVYSADILAEQDQRYELRLIDDQGLENKLPPRITIDVHKNMPPELAVVFPNRDLDASPIEELTLEAEVSDDYGVTGYGLSYTLAGIQSKDLLLNQSQPTNDKQKIQYLLALEDLNAQPDQLLTYYFWADDIGPNGNIRRTSSDMYFAEVRPFEEIYRESQSFQDRQNQNQSGQQQGQQGEELIQLQKQIISATWNVKQRAEQSGSLEKQKEDLDVVRGSQADALQQAQSASAQSEEPTEMKTLQEAAKHMNTSLEHLSGALESSSTEELTPALASEQLAYQELLKLRQRESQITRGGNMPMSGSRSARSDQQLQQLELTQRENRYETQRSAQAQDQTVQREDLQVLNRLRELARRQDEMSNRLRDVQAELQQARNDEQREEINRELKRLREQQLEVLRDVDELAQRMDRPENRQRMANTREQLDQSRSGIQQSAEELEQGMVSRAVTSTTRAQQQLEEMRDEFQRRTSGEFTEQMRDMLDQAQQLDREQKEIAEQIENQKDSEQKTLTSANTNQELSERVQQQRSNAENLLDQMKNVSEQSENSEPLLSRRLYDTVRQANSDNLDRALETTGELLRRNFVPQAQEIEKRAAEGIENLRQGVEDAARNVLGDESDSLRLARQQLDELIRQADEEAARAGNSGRQQSGEPNQPAYASRVEGVPPSNRGQDARDTGDNDANTPTGTSGQRQDRASGNQPQEGNGRATANNTNERNRQAESTRGTGEQQGSQRGGAMAGDPNSETATARANEGGQSGPGGFGSNQAVRWDGRDPNGPFTGRDFTQWSDRLRDVEEVLTERDLREEAARIRDRAVAIRAEFKRHGTEPQWDLLRQQIIDPLTELRKHVSDKLAQLASDQAPVPIDRDPVPSRFTEMVRRYYETLGGD